MVCFSPYLDIKKSEFIKLKKWFVSYQAIQDRFCSKFVSAAIVKLVSLFLRSKEVELAGDGEADLLLVVLPHQVAVLHHLPHHLPALLLHHLQAAPLWQVGHSYLTSPSHLNVSGYSGGR